MAATDISIFQMMLNASLIVQLVVLILVILSIGCWALIIGKSKRSSKLLTRNLNFDKEFWSGVNLHDLYLSSAREIKNNGEQQLALNERIFVTGMREYNKFKDKNITNNAAVLTAMQRTMHVRCQQEIDQLENGMTYLGSVASAAPYIGLLGTVWGIMHAFTGLSAISQVTLATVAPGIAEALVATAIGLMTAIPAVLGYNYFTRKNERLILQMESFSDDFINIMQRNLTGTTTKSAG